MLLSIAICEARKAMELNLLPDQPIQIAIFARYHHLQYKFPLEGAYAASAASNNTL